MRPVDEATAPAEPVDLAHGGETARLPALAPLERAIFAAPRSDPRRRRPTDVLFLLAAIAVASVMAQVAAGNTVSEARVASGIADALGWLEPLWRVAYAATSVLCVVLLVFAVVGRNRALVRDLVTVAALTLVAGLVTSRLVMGEWPALGAVLVRQGTASFPATRIGLAVALTTVAGPALTRPMRRFAHVVVGFGAVGALALGVAYPSHLVGGFAIGVAAGAAVRLAFGSQLGFPSAARVGAALDDVHCTVTELHPAPEQREGVASFVATRGDETLAVKVYGRDARDAQLFVRLWRLLWYRDARPQLSFTRVQLVEHEALMLFAAEQAGAPVPHVVVAGRAGSGDSLLVTQIPESMPLAELDGRPLDDATLRAAFVAAGRLGAARIGHGRIDLGAIRVHDRDVVLTDFQGARLTAPQSWMAGDLAALLVSLALVAGNERAIAAAMQAAGAPAVVEMLPYVQGAALTPALRESVRHAHFDLEQLRKDAADAAKVEVAALAAVRRVTPRTVLLLALVAFAAYTIIAQLADVGFSTLVDLVREATWVWVVVAVVLAQCTLVFDALATQAAVSAPLPLGPLTLLQSAIKFISVGMPSSAGKIALNIRFLQKEGVGPTAAVTQGTLDAIFGFLVQALILLILLPGSDLELQPRNIDAKHLLVAGLVALAIVVAGVIVVAAMPKLRQRVVEILHSARDAVRAVLRSPRRSVQLLLANFGSQLFFALCLGAALRAYGAHLSIGDLLVVNTFVTLFAGLMPVPGGVGVAEAALTAALTAFGIPSDIAFAAALTHRFASYYLPPVPGYFSLRWLSSHSYV